jgi:Flp pilus assembly CpaE family ATPase
MATELPQSEIEPWRNASDSSKRRPVFLFVGCPEGVLSSFEKEVHERAAAGSVEPIAVSGYPSPEYLRAFLEENREDVSCVTIGLHDPAQAGELLGMAAEITPNALILGADDGSQSEFLLPALRAGARDVIAPPYDMKAAGELIDRPERQEPDGLGKLACFLPSQGGAGASTAAIHFAASISTELSAKGEHEGPTSPVLLLDLDFHSDSTAFWLNRRPAYTLTDALEGAVASPAYWRKITAAWNGIDLLAPPPPDRYVSEKLLEALPTVVESARKVYPWVVADLPPTLFASSRNLLPNANFVFLVCTPEARALYLARRRLSDLRHLSVHPEALRITLNRAGAKRSIEAATAEKAIGVEVNFSVDNDYLEISSAYSDRRLASPSSAPGRQFKSMARVAMGLQEQMAEKASGWRRLVGLG